MLCALVVTIGGALTPMDARSEYPDKPIKLVVSFPPGSGTDSNARYLARKMEERLGKPVVVENRPGGNSFIAAQTVTRAEPDGYTLLLASNSPVATNVAMFRKLPYDPVSELAPIARLGVGAMALVVSATSRYQTVDALLSAARSTPAPSTMARAAPRTRSRPSSFWQWVTSRPTMCHTRARRLR
jgi:tripartite-type tricarboxylate transporter receptor subunit TctC